MSRKMNIIQYVEMEENEHGLIGIGKIRYKYVSNNSHHTLTITIPLVDKVIEYTGTKAKNVYYKIINDTHLDTVNLIKRIACDSVGIPIIRLKEKSRKQEVVWARNLVFWYVNKYLRYSLSVSGQLFGMNHATVIHGIREINKENKYQKEIHQLWKKRFLDKCVYNNLFAKNEKLY